MSLLAAVLLPIIPQNLLPGQQPARVLPITRSIHCARCKAVPSAIKVIDGLDTSTTSSNTGRPEGVPRHSQSHVSSYLLFIVTGIVYGKTIDRTYIK